MITNKPKMEHNKIEEIDHNLDGDHICADKQTCLLEESDTQCGYVFYNEFTRLLKFYCTYCRETYDNIEYFCLHLSDHINESNEDIYNEIEPKVFKKEGVEEDPVAEIEDCEDISLILLKDNELMIDGEEYPQRKDENTEESFEYEHQLEKVPLRTESTVCDQIVDNLNNEDMLIEEIEDVEEIHAEVEQGMLVQMKEERNDLLISETSPPKEIINYEEKVKPKVAKTFTPIDNANSGNSFEECFIKETNIDKIRSEGVCVLKEKNNKGYKPIQRKRSNIQDLLRLKRRRKKVTTVKVIAVKNRIAELYERIQNEQQKSQQFFSNDYENGQQEQETQDAIESLIKDNVEADNTTELLKKNQTDADNKTSQTTEVSRKIIGETLITLIPEGTKIPNKMPSSLNIPTNNELINNEQLLISNTPSYNHYKTEEKKEKMAVCPACGKTFRSHFSLTIHKRIHYLESDSSVKLAHKCSDCDQLFNKLSQLKHHVESVHYPEGFICKICNRQLSSLSLLERHMVKVHLDRPFNCKKCNKNFSDPITFEEHLASHNSGEVFKCTTCGRKYSTEYFLLEHMRNHKEQVPQTCVVCGKITLRITQHMKIHTPRPKRLLSCSECGKVFNFSSGLSHHFKIMHKLPRPPPKTKKEPHTNAFKRKRRSRTNERCMNRRKPLTNSSSTDSTFVIKNENFPDQIIEEQIEIHHETLGAASHTPVSKLESQENHCIAQQANLLSSSQRYILNSRGHNQTMLQNVQQDDVINHKEEEAKRVIVELIQNSTYTSFFPDNFSSVLEVTPPIAREETISAVNSIVHDC